MSAVRYASKYGPTLRALDTLRRLVDIFMFAGVLGTSSLAKDAVNLIASDPGLYEPMWCVPRAGSCCVLSAAVVMFVW